MFSLNLDSHEIQQVLNADISHYACDDFYVYFSNQKDNGFLYRANLKTGEQTFLAPIANALNVQILQGKPYFYARAVDPSPGVGVVTYRIDTTNWSYERLMYYEDFYNTLK